MHDIETAKLQKEVDDELLLNRSFKGSYSYSHLNKII